MRKTVLLLSGLAMLTILSTSGVKKVNNAGGVTGSTGGCGCHGSAPAGTTLTLTGLTANVTAGSTYPFSLVYTQTGRPCQYWGLDLSVSAGKLTVGTGMKLKSGSTTELTHSSPLNAGSLVATYNYPTMQWNTTGIAVGTVVTFKFSCVGSTTGISSSSTGKDFHNTFTATIVAPTPVHFASFNASWAGENKVNLNWKTSTEVNANIFEIERSIDGENYTTFNKVAAVGNSTTTQSYTATDIVNNISNVVYYRIKELDKNGGYVYSEISAVKLSPAKDYVKTIFPNPSIGNQPVHIRYVATSNAKVNVDLYNCLGRKMNSATLDVVNGENDLNFKPGHFITPGMYYIVVNTGTDKVAQLPLSIQ